MFATRLFETGEGVTTSSPCLAASTGADLTLQSQFLLILIFYGLNIPYIQTEALMQINFLTEKTEMSELMQTG